ncbi:MAG TPA: protein-disulfide reductase DsbD domain-containing protein [Candidatus Cybelea sp.]|nr:protein-disulfide reductase DsbD domain-containing protein [Candidatus Cybelea sp.]
MLDRVRKRHRLAAGVFALMFAAGAGAQIQPATSVVKPHAYVSLEPVPRGKEFDAAVVIDIARGYHMNSHKPTDPYLIPTSITPELPKGFRLVDTSYPPGQLERFPFSPDKPLDVYTGSVTLRLKFAALEEAALGAASIPMTLRYQACNDSACLPPVRVPVVVDLRVAERNAKAHTVHPDIFGTGSPR